MREYSSAEVAELTLRFKKRPGKKYLHGNCLWDKDGDNIILNDPEMSK